MSTHEDRLEEWLDIRARKHRGPGVEIKIKKSRRPRVVREIPKDRRLLVDLPPALMARLKGFVARSKVNYPWEYYIIQLLTEALDHRGYQLRPGQGRGRMANTDIDLHPLALDLAPADEEQ